MTLTNSSEFIYYEKDDLLMHLVWPLLQGKPKFWTLKCGLQMVTCDRVVLKFRFNKSKNYWWPEMWSHVTGGRKPGGS